MCRAGSCRTAHQCMGEHRREQLRLEREWRLGSSGSDCVLSTPVARDMPNARVFLLGTDGGVIFYLSRLPGGCDIAGSACGNQGFGGGKRRDACGGCASGVRVSGDDIPLEEIKDRDFQKSTFACGFLSYWFRLHVFEDRSHADDSRFCGETHGAPGIPADVGIGRVRIAAGLNRRRCCTSFCRPTT